MKIAIPVSASITQFYINFAYVKYVKEAGFEPILVTMENDALLMADFCDGLLLPGGGDIDPVFYDEDNICSYSVEPEKDDFERKLYHAFLEKEKKVFGICRGFQIIFREFIRLHPVHSINLDYYQHYPEHSLAAELKTARYIRTHGVRCKQDNLYGDGNNQTENMYVNSMHHQVARAVPGQGGGTTYNYGPLTVIAHTRHGMSGKKKEPGFIIEAINVDIGGGVRGVQWHPEELRDIKLLQYFFLDQTVDEQNPAKKKVAVEAPAKKMNKSVKEKEKKDTEEIGEV